TLPTNPFRARRFPRTPAMISPGLILAILPVTSSSEPYVALSVSARTTTTSPAAGPSGSGHSVATTISCASPRFTVAEAILSTRTSLRLASTFDSCPEATSISAVFISNSSNKNSLLPDVEIDRCGGANEVAFSPRFLALLRPGGGSQLCPGLGLLAIGQSSQSQPQRVQLDETFGVA